MFSTINRHYCSHNTYYLAVVSIRNVYFIFGMIVYDSSGLLVGLCITGKFRLNRMND